MAFTTEEAVRHIAKTKAQYQAELDAKYPAPEHEHSQLTGCTCTSRPGVCTRCKRVEQENSLVLEEEEEL